MAIGRYEDDGAPPGDAQNRSGDVLTRRRLLHLASSAGAAAPLLGALGPRPVVVEARHDNRRQSPSGKRVLTIASFAPPLTLDPHAAYEFQSTVAILGAYEGLIRLKDDSLNQYEGLIAESWEANADRSVWTFHLRDGVTFHDGSPVDAEAVRASFERFLALGFAPVAVIARFFTDPNQITAPDPRTVVFDLGRPQPLFAAAIASIYGPEIVNAKLLKQREKGGDWGHAWAETNEDGTGSGPYRIVSFDPSRGVELERYDGYWRGWTGDHFDRIVIRVVPEESTRRQLIEQGAVDAVDNMTPETIDALKQNPALVVAQHESTQVEYFIMNTVGPLASTDVRRAICGAFPYDDVVTGVYNGYAKVATGPVAEIVRGFAPPTDRCATDLAGAKTLLSSAGVPTGTRLRLAIESSDANILSTAELFQTNLTQIGFEVDVEQYDHSAYTGLLFGAMPPQDRPHLMWWGWWPDYDDALDHLYPQIACAAAGPGGGNAGFYCNQEVEALLTLAQGTFSAVEYRNALAEIQEIVSYVDPPAVYYLQPTWTTILRNDVTGFVFNPIYLGTYDFWKLGRATTQPASL